MSTPAVCETCGRTVIVPARNCTCNPVHDETTERHRREWPPNCNDPACIDPYHHGSKAATTT